MCGIAGVYNWGNRATLEQMASVQHHRGPDDGGVWDRHLPEGGYLGLASRRLAIIDLSAAGHMPMGNAEHTLWITYNGEIYNFPELRRELLARGHQFRSASDTEVVLRLYEQEGAECVKRLNGMFAFCICDLRDPTPTFFLARDHFGIKPLYYVWRGGQFAFASEVKALLALPGVSAEPDPHAVAQFFTFQWVPEPATMFRGILKVPAGHYATFRDGQLKLTRYWDLQMPASGASADCSEAELAEAVRGHLRRSVRAQMISDVPLGAFLSAGLDSSSIVALMAQVSDKPVRTYTITYPARYRVGENTLDDPAVAARLARKLGCVHQELVVEPQVVDLLPKLVWHMDEPVADPAILAAYLICREARNTVTVLLSGIGGDEVFAGYRKYLAANWGAAYRKLPRALRWGAEQAAAHVPSMRGTPLKGPLRLGRKMIRSASLPPLEAFLMNATYLTRDQLDAVCSDSLRAGFAGWDPTSCHRAWFANVAHADFLNQMLYVDTKAFMVSLNLVYNDKMSMANSVEVRVPFLDRELVEFAARNVPPRLKLRGRARPVTKYILRRAMKDILPDEVLRQPKAAFAAPVDYWLANDLREMVDDLLSETQLKRRGCLQPTLVRQMIEQHRSGRHDWSMQVWQFLTFELWMRTFVDQTAGAPQLRGAAAPV